MRLTVDGKSVFAATGGRPFDPALPAIVFVHGAGFDRTVWQLQTRWFAHHGRSVLAVDLPGYGGSEGPPHGDVGATADWIPRLLDSAGVERAALVGHSMGALVALECAARHPGRVERLALCGVAAEMPVHPDLLASAKEDRPNARELMTGWGLGRDLQTGGAAAPGLWLTQVALANLERAPKGAIHAALVACDVWKGAPAAAARVSCPALFVLGDSDQMTPAAKAKPLAAAIAGSRTVVVAGAGHFMMVERPDATLDALRSFL